MMFARKGITVVLTVLVAILLTAGCAPEQQAEAPAEVARNVRVLDLAPTDVTEYLEITGPMAPVRGAVVSAEESGSVFAVPHDKGDVVQEGDVLVELDRRLLAAELEAARANVELQDYSAAKVSSLYEAEKVSRLELLTARNAAAQARAQLAVVERRYDRSAVAAPFAGLVTDRYVEPGELVAPGTPVARVVDPSALKLVGVVTERDVAGIDEGSQVEVTLDGSDGMVVGEVVWVGFEADPLTGKFTVEIRVPNPDGGLRSGVVGRARIRSAEHVGVIAVPRDAVLSTPEGRAVYVVESDRARLRSITTGADQGLMVLVVDGLAAGDRLVVRGQRDLIEGALVKVTETTDNADGSAAGDPDVIRDEDSRVRASGGEEAVR